VRDELREELREDEYELLARLAQRYYVDERTQEEIAREFALSRPKVQRLLDRARRSGVVAIHIQAPPWLRLELESQLRETFGLSDAIVCSAGSDPLAEREAVAQRAARYLERRLHDGCVVAVSHGRAVGEVPRFFRPGSRLDVTFVSAMGGSPGVAAPTNPNEICRALAAGCGGQAVSLYAPAYVESVEIRDQLLAQEAIAQSLDRAAQASVALVGIGGTDDGCTMVRSGCLTTDEIALAAEPGGGRRRAGELRRHRRTPRRLPSPGPASGPDRRTPAPRGDGGGGGQRTGEAAGDPGDPACWGDRGPGCGRGQRAGRS
jgi:DNA-binding transcriptional regulator LsrR (DeoR family)